MRLTSTHAIALMLSLTGAALAADTGVVRLHFQDSRTGAAVLPDSLRIDGQEWGQTVDPAGRAEVMLAFGSRSIVVEGAGYSPLVATLVVSASTPLNTILLDPAQSADPHAATASGARAAVDQAGNALLTGYVVDDESGALLGDVVATDSVSRATAVTDAGGFFSLAVPVFDGEPVPGDPEGRFFSRRTLTVSKAGYGVQAWNDVLAVQESPRVLNLRLRRGEGVETYSEKSERGQLVAHEVDGCPAQDESGTVDVGSLSDASSPRFALGAGEDVSAVAAAAEPMPQSQSPPASIRVGRNCQTKTTCSTVQIMSMETYTKHVLPAEWFTTWHLESHKAGAVAVRSYGAWYTFNPLTPTYDICDTTSCQVYKDATNPATDQGVDATANIYVVDSSGNIGRAEYSAENNHSGTCADCYTINNPNDTVCLSDDVCCGTTTNGHGRGMCQWGTQRWASNRSQLFAWIVDHYYDAYGWHREAFPPVITQQPLPVTACAGASPAFVVAAVVRSPVTYRWRKNAVNLSDGGHIFGAATATLSISPVDATDAASYDCVITDANGTSTSSSAALTVKAATALTQQPLAQTGCPGGTFEFTVSAVGDGTLSYSWQKNGADLADGGHYSGTGTTVLTITGADAADAANYRCAVRGGCGLIYSNVVSLSLNPPFAAADFNQDTFVDQMDFGHLQACFSGLAAQNDSLCNDAHLASGAGIGDPDLTIFLQCMAGPGVVVDPCCGQ